MNAGAAAKGKGAADAEQRQRVKELRTAEQRRTLGSRLERRKAAGEGATAGAGGRRSCSSGMEPGGGEERWRKTKIPGDKNFKLRVVWYFFLFSSGQRSS